MVQLKIRVEVFKFSFCLFCLFVGVLEIVNMHGLGVKGLGFRAMVANKCFATSAIKTSVQHSLIKTAA